jgi:putative transposase
MLAIPRNATRAWTNRRSTSRPRLTHNYHRDFSVKAEQRVSILTLDGRVIISYTGYTRHVALMRQGAQIAAAKLWYDKPRKQFYLLVSLELEVADPTPEAHQDIVGVDVGQRYLAVATDTQNKTTFFPGKAVRAKADHYARLRKRLRQKGTRSATRRLVVIAGRERRLKQDRDHLISRRIVDAYPHALIGLEDLSNIRERTRRKRGKRASAERIGAPRRGHSRSCIATSPIKPCSLAAWQ